MAEEPETPWWSWLGWAAAAFVMLAVACGALALVVALLDGTLNP